MEKTLELLSDELNRRIEADGMDALIAQAEIIYSSMYRSQPYPASKIEEKYWPELSQEIRDGIIDAAFDKEFPEFSDDMHNAIMEDDDSSVYQMDGFKEQWVDSKEEEFPEIVITKNTQLVDLVNYKGEGEGQPTLYSLAKSLQVFVSKYNYI